MEGRWSEGEGRAVEGEGRGGAVEEEGGEGQWKERGGEGQRKERGGEGQWKERGGEGRSSGRRGKGRGSGSRAKGRGFYFEGGRTEVSLGSPAPRAGGHFISFHWAVTKMAAGGQIGYAQYGTSEVGKHPLLLSSYSCRMIISDLT